MKTLTLAILATLALLTGCSGWQSYNSTVAARQIGVSAQGDPAGDAKAAINYRVEYR